MLSYFFFIYIVHFYDATWLLQGGTAPKYISGDKRIRLTFSGNNLVTIIKKCKIWVILQNNSYVRYE